MVQGDGASALRSRRTGFDGVLFTGSWAVGASSRPTRSAEARGVEMGGKNGVLVCADADLDAAAQRSRSAPA
jgi:acyl-CoA reductase-like NAD-dependent aldehyde dehydrogenase